MSLTGMFYLLCVITGQYVNFEVFHNSVVGCETLLSKALTSATVLLALACFIVLNVFAVGFDIYVVSSCALSLNCGYIYHFSTVQMTNVSHGLQLTAPQMNQVNDWNKVVVTSATLSGALSYLFMVLVLYGRYTRPCETCYKGTDCLLWIIEKIFSKCATRLHSQPEYYKDFSKPDPNELVINPFIDDEYMVGDSLKDICTTNKLDNGDGSYGGEGRGAGGDRKQNQYVSSLLTLKQSVCFQFIFWFNFCVYTASVGMFIWILVGQLDSFNPILEGLDLAGLIAQFVSQFSALISCFIFSKVAYAVSNRCIDFSKCIFQVANTPRVTKNNQGEEIETDNWRNLKTGLGFSAAKKVDHLTVLKAMDQRYTLMLKNSLSPFGLWFTIHWVLYTLTAFMSIAYVADKIIMELYGTEPQDVKCHWEKDLNCIQSLVYTMLFALFHCILPLPVFPSSQCDQGEEEHDKVRVKRRMVRDKLDREGSFCDIP